MYVCWYACMHSPIASRQMAWLLQMAISLGPNPADGSHRRPRSKSLDAAQPYQTGGLLSRLNSTPDSALHLGCINRVGGTSFTQLQKALGTIHRLGCHQWIGRAGRESKWLVGVYDIGASTVCGEKACIASWTLSPLP